MLQLDNYSLNRLKDDREGRKKRRRTCQDLKNDTFGTLPRYVKAEWENFLGR